MTTPTPTAQSSACADEVHAQFVRGSECEVPTILITKSRYEKMSADLDMFGQDLLSARDDLRDAERARDAALRQLAKAIEILTDIQARVREVGV